MDLRMIRLLLITVLLGFYHPVFSCGNEFGRDKSGKMVFTEHFYLSKYNLLFDTVALKQNLKLVQEKINRNPSDFKQYSNKGLYLMKLGKTAQAKAIFEKLIIEHPDDYTINANLGTAYELSGQLDSALKYISRGVEIKKNAHWNSEWIHVLLLKAKIENKKNKDYLTRENAIVPLDSLLGIIDSSDTESHRPIRNLRKFHRQISIQIRTRAPFTPAPNAVMANLMESLGSLHHEKGSYENAFLAYAYAIRYANDYRVKVRVRKKLSSLNKERKSISNVYGTGPMFANTIRLAKLDPHLLNLGLDNFAEYLDSVEVSRFEIQKQEVNESLNKLQNKIDSLTTVLQKKKTREKKLKDQDENSISMWTLITCIPVLLLLLYIRWKKENN